MHHTTAALLLQGGSAFSPSILHTPSTSRRQALDLAKELGCVTSDLADDEKLVSCLRATPVHTLNAAQTKVQFTNFNYGAGSESKVQVSARLTCSLAAATGGQRSVPVLVSGPSGGLSLGLPQSRPAAGNV